MFGVWWSILKDKRRRKAGGEVSRGGGRVAREVGTSTDQFVLLLLGLPAFLIALEYSGQSRSAESELFGGIVFTIACWVGATVLAWNAGGPSYLAGRIALTIVVAPLLAWVGLPLLSEPTPRGAGLTRVLMAAPILCTVAVVLAWRFELWVFEQEKTRAERHPIAVFHVDPPEKDYDPYFIAICECGWLGDFFDHAEPAFRDARKHSPRVEPELQRPLDPDYVRRRSS